MMKNNIVLSKDGKQIPRSQITGKPDLIKFPDPKPQEGIKGLTNNEPGFRPKMSTPPKPTFKFDFSNKNIQQNKMMEPKQAPSQNQNTTALSFNTNTNAPNQQASFQNQKTPANSFSQAPNQQNQNPLAKASFQNQNPPANSFSQAPNQNQQVSFQNQNPPAQAPNQNQQASFQNQNTPANSFSQAPNQNQQASFQNQNPPANSFSQAPNQNQQASSQNQNAPMFFNKNAQAPTPQTSTQNQNTPVAFYNNNTQQNKFMSTNQEKTQGKQEFQTNKPLMGFNSQSKNQTIQGTISLKSNEVRSKLKGKYDQSYTPISKFDILNLYYQMCQCPNQVKQETLSKLATHLIEVIGISKISASDQSKSPMQRIKIQQIQNIAQPYQTEIRRFWLETLNEFINSHPYCTEEGVLQLIIFHIKQNKQTYYPDGVFNLKTFQQNKIFKDQEINKMSSFFLNIQKNLQEHLALYVNYFLAIIAKIPHSSKLTLLKDQEIVKKIWFAFKTIYNPDNILQYRGNVHEKIGLDLISMLLQLHNKNSAHFQNFTIDFIRTIDSKISVISPNFDVSSLDNQDKSVSTSIAKKCIKLANLLLLKFPSQGKWDDILKNQIVLIKSKTLYPFKWLLPELLHGNQSKIKIKYFPIIGVQWFHLLIELLNMNSSQKILKYNEPFQQIIFFLACSIIQQNPINFWTNSQQCTPIYNYISQLYKSVQLQKKSKNKEGYEYEIGKLARIMICTCGKSSLQLKKSQIPSQLLNRFSKDTIMQTITQDNQLALSTLLLQYFCNNILDLNTANEQLFGELLQIIIMKKSSTQKPNIEEELRPINSKYHYQQSQLIIYELFQRMMTQNPNFINTFYQIWNMKCHRLNKNQLKFQDELTFVWEFTFGFIIRMEPYLLGKVVQMELNHQIQNQQYQIIPRVLQLLNKLVKTPHCRKLTFALLIKEENKDIKKALFKSTLFYSCAEALVNHVQCVYEYMYEYYMVVHDDKKGPWISMCKQILQQYIKQWQQLIARHFANITRIVLHKKCRQMDAQAISTNPLSKYKGTQLIKIEQLVQFQKYLIQYMIWALKVQEDSVMPQYFYNTLYINRKYESLEAALKLLQVLVVAFMRYHDRIDFSESMKKFLFICQPINIFNMSLFSQAQNLTRTQQIPLSNKKVASIPAVLAYIVCTPYLSRSSQVKDHESPKAKQIRCIALNILNMIVTNNINAYGMYVSLQKNNINFNQAMQLDPISRIDFNIHQSFFVNDFQKAYCSAKDFLISYVRQQILLSNKYLPSTLKPAMWFQSTYNYGQLIDMVTLMYGLFNSTQIKNAIQERIKPELLDGDNLILKVKNFLEQSDPLNPNSSQKQYMKSELMGYICDDEATALSRYALQLSLFYNENPSQKQTQMQKHFLKVTEVLISKIINLKQFINSTIPQQISLNILKIVRVLQTKKNQRLYTEFLVKYYAFILNEFHTNIQNSQYVREYLISIRLVLSCSEYLDPVYEMQIKNIYKLQFLLMSLMENIATKPKYYVVLLYCLHFFLELNSDPSIKQVQLKLKSIYNIVEWTINPLITEESHFENLSPSQKASIQELSQDISVISLMMFFRQYLHQSVFYSRDNVERSTYQLLILDIENSQSTEFNSKSLLLNYESNSSIRSIQMAIKICRSSCHHIEFVSACNHIYKALTIAKDYLYENNNRIMKQFLKVITGIFNNLKRSSDQESWRNNAYKVAWACNLLYVMVGYTSSKSLVVQISEILFKNVNLLSLLGQLLSFYAEYQIKWPYNMKIMSKSTLGLLEKELLHSILKVYLVLVSKYDDWSIKGYSGSQDSAKNDTFFTFCKALISSSRVLMVQNKSKSNMTEYEQTLQKIPLKLLYVENIKQNSKILNQSNKIVGQAPAGLKQIFPSCQNALDLFHDHFNLLIKQKFLMLMLSCYKNSDLTLESYEFKDILDSFEDLTKRLITISPNENIFETNMQNLSKKYWSCFRMNTSLYYLNTIQQSPKDELEILNNIAEMSVKCTTTLKRIMQMHQDSRQFNIYAEKIMKKASRHKVFKFQIQQDLRQGGFELKSQYGTSYMMSPSIKINR